MFNKLSEHEHSSIWQYGPNDIIKDNKQSVAMIFDTIQMFM